MVDCLVVVVASKIGCLFSEIDVFWLLGAYMALLLASVALCLTLLLVVLRVLDANESIQTLLDV